MYYLLSFSAAGSDAISINIVKENFKYLLWSLVTPLEIKSQEYDSTADEAVECLQ